ncbi:decaprenyl-phosphate phosphoribosyltransferase [Candidatus Woesearchaeota archaeon]|nr:decaprenyl-phosphate phosphoribosyltransferase [Candidatus Woesearchaeota archaeon]MBT4764451.1 decaprenyl-phosphate phosphoribosyltransferase [bacterium]
MVNKYKNLFLSLVRLIRPHQYVKNLFIFAPLFFSGALLDLNIAIQGGYVFILFSLLASSVYIFNDIMDVDQDRAHPSKKNRPIASGQVSVLLSVCVMLVFLLLAFLLAFFISANLLYIATLYILINILYSFKLKHYPIIDVSIIALGFVLRVFAGSTLLESSPSIWIVLMTYLLALFLAFAKRRDDVLLSNNGLHVRKSIDGYNLDFVNAAMIIVASVTIVSYILYTISDSVQIRLDSDYLYLTVFFVITGILRYLQITFVENNSGSPTKVVLRDRFLKINTIAWILSFAFIIYG